MRKLESVNQIKRKGKVRLDSALEKEDEGTKSSKAFGAIKDYSYSRTLKRVLLSRKFMKLIIDGLDVTPVLMQSARSVQFGQLTAALSKSRWTTLGTKFQHLFSTASAFKTDEFASKQSFAMKTTMEDIMAYLSISVVSSEDIPIWKQRSEEEEELHLEQPKMSPYIKVLLRETEDFVLFEKASVTVPKGTKEAKYVEEDNQKYEYLTVGKGRVRRKAEGEAQTTEILRKTRYVNTEKIRKQQVGTFVSNYDMYDTYADLEKITTSVELENRQIMEITTYKPPGGEDQMEEILQNPNFQLAVMLTQRLLAGNVFTEKQKRFRNMYMPDPLDLNITFSYTLDPLWTFPPIPGERRAVSCISWCPNNGDILAVAYGLYTFVPISKLKTGYVCVWSIKNPINPERVYKYDMPVISVEFSSFNTQLLAIGLHDGSVELRDLTNSSAGPVAISQRRFPPSYAINQLRWMIHTSEEERILAVSADGYVMKYRIVNGPYLLGMSQMKLNRIVGSPEGLFVYRKEGFIEANRNPRALTLTVHPEKSDLYYVLTDEGCMYKCSTNYPHQYLELLQVHEGSVYCMDFSPWSSKVFLTCGSDWCIRIWVEGILESIIKLTCGIGPVHCAYWSRTHSTIILSVTRDAVQIWDIRRSILKPVAVKAFPSSVDELTIAKFSNCGRSVAVGNEDGRIFMCAFEDMPFPPYFQYQELENALFRAIRAYPELTREVKSLGYFGYPGKDKPKIIDDVPKSNDNETVA